MQRLINKVHLNGSQKVVIRKLPTGVPGLDEILGGGRTPFAGRIVREIDRRMSRPAIDDRLGGLPGRIDHISPVKKRGVSDHAIIKKLFVACCRGDVTKLVVIKIHFYPASPDGRPWNFSPNLKTDRLLGLDMKDQSVGADRVSFIGVKNIERRAFEVNHDFRAVFG